MVRFGGVPMPEETVEDLTLQHNFKGHKGVVHASRIANSSRFGIPPFLPLPRPLPLDLSLQASSSPSVTPFLIHHAFGIDSTASWSPRPRTTRS